MARSVAGGAAPSRLNRKFLFVAVLLAVLSAVLVYAKISATSDSSKSSSGGAGDVDRRRHQGRRSSRGR